MCCIAAGISDSCLLFFSDALWFVQQHTEDILLLQLLGFPTAVDIFYYNERDSVACFWQQVGFLTYSCLLSPASDKKLIHVSSSCLFFSYCNLSL
jgi:hypothetical protein